MAEEISGEEKIKVPAKEYCLQSVAVRLPADFGACVHDCMRGPPCDDGRLCGSQIATDFILHAPFGELREVVSDVQVLCGGESVLADALPVTSPPCVRLLALRRPLSPVRVCTPHRTA